MKFVPLLCPASHGIHDAAVVLPWVLAVWLDLQGDGHVLSRLSPGKMDFGGVKELFFVGIARANGYAKELTKPLGIDFLPPSHFSVISHHKLGGSPGFPEVKVFAVCRRHRINHPFSTTR